MAKREQVTEPRRGRPRTSAPGSRAVYTDLAPEVLAAVDAAALKDRRSRSATVAILIEEALAAREKLK